MHKYEKTSSNCMKPVVLSIGGSIIVPDDVDYFFLKELKNFVLEHVGKGYRFVLMCGGGRTNSRYNLAAQRVSDVAKDDLDWIGIMATRLNAELVRAVFGNLAHSKVLTNPNTKIRTKKPVIVAAGWKPGWSTDFDAVLMGKQIGVKDIINLTNIDYVFDKDPRDHKDARPVLDMTWKEYRRLVGDKWTPRLSSPFDPIASKEAQAARMKVAIMNGKDLENLRKYLQGKSFKGTLIH